jgi:hypothetical protein
MNITLKDNLSGANVISEDGLSQFILGVNNPETLEPWSSEADLRTFIKKAASNPNYWSAIVAPEPIPLSYIRYISLVKAAGGLSAAVATSIVDGTHASDEVNFLQRLMEKHSGDFVVGDPMVQSGLDVLLSEGVVNQAGRDAIEANWPVE